MARKRKQSDAQPQEELPFSEGGTAGGADEEAGGGDEELLEEGKIICNLTGEHRTATPQEETLQSFIEQLHREYSVAFEDMARDVRIACESEDPERGGVRKKMRNVSLVVYEPGAAHEPENIIRAVLVAPPAAKADKSVDALEDVLANLDERHDRVFGVWTNGAELAFRMREYHARTGEPQFTELTDFPAPHETLEDLESAERRPLRIATKDSLLRSFKHCHDYLYGNQSMRGDKAFWQLLYLIFCKIYDEHQSRRRFFVGATEANAEAGRKAVAKRIRELFEEVKEHEYKDVFDGNERIELNDRALSYVAAELGRYSLLSTDTDAKGMAYEAITSTTLKRERGQFFTPRNVIRMMVEMMDPRRGFKVLDPACGSGGFLVVTLAHVRKQLLREIGAHPELPVPKELKRIDKDLRKYARDSLYGLDVDPDLKKAARMNMVMNNDGHGNVCAFNSLEYGIAGLRTPEMEVFEKRGGGHGKFDYVFTNPPFGSKIPVTDQTVLEAYDLGHFWSRAGDRFVMGGVQKRVPPEILFIEACYKFLKPGTGVMALILPNGILGNPGEQMEAVRWWMMWKMELLASVDLPAEAFLPQVSVQASCVFLRRRDENELRLAGPKGPKQGPVFMAIAENCGHGRRGEPMYVKKPDGGEDIQGIEVPERWERNGRIVETMRRKQVRLLADDMPWIVTQYAKFRAGESLEAQ